MAKEIIHTSPAPEIVGEFDPKVAASLAKKYLKISDESLWNHREWIKKVTSLLPDHIFDPQDDSELDYIVETQADFQDPKSLHSNALLPHVDGVGETLIGSSRLDTIFYEGVVPIPSGLSKEYFEGMAPDSNQGSGFFDNGEGLALVTQAIESGDLHAREYSSGTLSLLARTTIHASREDDPVNPDFGEPRLLVIGFNSMLGMIKSRV